MSYVTPPKLQPGDRVCLVSPASTPSKHIVENATKALEDIGLKVELGKHIFDKFGYLAGTDENRLSDINSALRDPGIKAVIASRGGKGAYRIADRLDFQALQLNPKLVIGFSEITTIHMALLKHCGLVSIHGAAWETKTFGSKTAESFRNAVTSTKPIVVSSTDKESTFALTTSGKVTGRLIGGNQDSFAISNGWNLPSLEGAILLLEAYNLRLGHIDRQLTMLMNSGALDGIRGVAVGQYTKCGGDSETQGNWTVIDVLRDRLSNLNVPILGGLPIGHGKNPIAVPIGAQATLDTYSYELIIEPGIK